MIFKYLKTFWQAIFQSEEEIPAEKYLCKCPATNAFKDLNGDEVAHLKEHQTCPYCDGDLYTGPQAGMSTNMFCENVDTCDSRFNIMWELGCNGQFTGPVPDSFKQFINTMRGYSQ